MFQHRIVINPPEVVRARQGRLVGEHRGWLYATMKTNIREKMTSLLRLFSMYSEAAEGIMDEKVDPARGAIDRNIENEWVAAQAQSAVNTVVVVGATLLVGIIVYAKIDSSTGNPANSDLNNSSQSVTNNVASSFDLGSILPIVIIAAAILFFLRGFGGGGGGGVQGGRR